MRPHLIISLFCFTSRTCCGPVWFQVNVWEVGYDGPFFFSCLDVFTLQMLYGCNVNYEIPFLCFWCCPLSGVNIVMRSKLKLIFFLADHAKDVTLITGVLFLLTNLLRPNVHRCSFSSQEVTEKHKVSGCWFSTISQKQYYCSASLLHFCRLRSDESCTSYHYQNQLLKLMHHH